METTEDVNTSPVPRWTIIVVAVIGGVLRVVQYTDRRSLWYDEAMLSLNVASRSWRDLLAPLDLDQAAPLLFLWLQRALVSTFGVNELTLRFVALASGLALPLVTWHLCLLYTSDAADE